MSKFKIKCYTTFFAFIVSFNCLHADLTNGLVAWYPFDGNASDMSGNGNDGAVYGATLGEDRNGEAGKAYEFDGVNDYITIPHTSLNDFDNESSYSVSLWAFIDQETSEGVYSIMEKWVSSSNPYPYVFRLVNDGSTYKMRYGVYEGGFPQDDEKNPVLITPELSNNQNYQITATYTNSEINLFLDGSKVSTSTIELESISNSYDITVGNLPSNSNVTYFKGSIDNIRIYNRALSEAEVQALYELEKPIYPTTASFFDIDAQLQNNEASFTAPKSAHYKVVLNALPDARFDVFSYWFTPVQWMSGFQYAIDSDSAVDHRFGPFSTKEEAFSAFENLVLFLEEGQIVTFSVPDYLFSDNSGGTSLVIYPFDPTDGLVAWYPFDGNASDMSGNGNDGAVYGATLGEDRNGEAGKAYEFDNNAYIVVPHDPLIDFNTTDPHTLSVWIKPENDSPSGSIISKWYDSYDPYPYTVRFNSDSFAISANIYTGGYPQISSNVLSTVSPLPEYLNGYGHVCAVFYPSEVKLFIDGEFLSSKQSELTSFNSSNSHSMFIGKRDGRSDRYFKGSIDDIRIYNRALSEAEVQALYELEKPTIDLTSGLVAWYPFDGNASDMSGNGNDGAVYGATLGEDRNGEAGKAYAFDGVDDYIHTAGNFVSPEYTVGGWIKSLSTAQAAILSMKQASNSDNTYFHLEHNGDGSTHETSNLRFLHRNPPSTDGGINIYSEQTLSDGNWHYITAVHDGYSNSLFVNGEKVDEISEINSFEQVSCSMFVGMNGVSASKRYYSGSIDDIRIYNRALSEAEVQALYELEKPIDTDGDGLLDYEEIVTYGTDPNDADSDDDGFIDGTEVNYGANPLSSDKAILDMITAEPSIYGFVTQKDYDDLFYSQETNATPYTPSWFYVPSRGWMWSQKQVYPWFYDHNSTNWMYFQSGHENPNFYHYGTKKWMTLE